MKQKMIICISILIVLVLTVIIVLNHPAFSRTPRGERLVRIERSPNYKEGQFVNQEPTPFMTTDKSRWRIMWDNLTEKKPDNLIPSESIHAVKTDLKRLNLSKDAVVWFGHSSYLLINGGKKILVDPVLTTGFPVSLMMKPFKGTDIYSPEDIPEVDYLIITHDHYDHLDYGTVKAIRDKVDKVICPLGVGEHLEYWGYSAEKIVEMDWNEVYTSEPGFRITCLTARHFQAGSFGRIPRCGLHSCSKGTLRSISAVTAATVPISRKSANGSRISTLPSSKTGNTTKTGGISIRCLNSFRQRFTSWMRPKSFRYTTANFHSPVTHGTSRSTASNRQQQRTAACMLYMVSSAAL